MSGSGRKVIPDVQVCSGGHPGCQRVVRNPFRMSGSCRKVLQDVQE